MNGWGRTISGRRNHKRRGQALVEFSLVAIVLMTLALGMVQYGLILNTSIILSQISRDTARYAALNAATDAKIVTYGKNLAASTSVKPTDLTVTVAPAQGAATRIVGQPITVTISYDMRKKYFLPTSFVGLAHFGSAYSVPTQMIIQNIS